jgi:regulator of protease activity HflC (stomatin/prohibitin superfamily)
MAEIGDFEFELTETQKKRAKIGLAVFIVFLIFGLGGFVNVPAGHKAVILSSPSGPSSTEIDEGWHWNPMYTLYDIEVKRYNMQTREMIGIDTVTVRSSDNLNVKLDVAIVYSFESNKVADIFIENANIDDIIDNHLRNAPRNIAANYTGEYIGGPGRVAVEDAIRIQITSDLIFYHVIVQDFLIRDVDLPATVDEAIEEKKAAEQQVVTANYTKQRQIIEADAAKQVAIIEAEGARNSTIIRANGSAQSVFTVMSMLQIADPDLENATSAYLTWLYLEALTNPNSNVGYVIITDGSGSPVIVDLAGIGTTGNATA